MADYEILCEQLESLAESNQWFLPVLANASALLYTQLPRLNWAGFYLRRNDELILGPFQGQPACVRIPFGKGVCVSGFHLGKVSAELPQRWIRFSVSKTSISFRGILPVTAPAIRRL